MNGKCITEEEHDYPFAKGGNAQKMLSEGLTGAGNRLRKAYANAGAIDHDPGYADAIVDLNERRLDGARVGDVALEAEPAEILCHRGRAVAIDVQYRDLRAGIG